MKIRFLFALLCAHFLLGANTLLATPPAVALTANAATVPRYDIYELTMVNTATTTYAHPFDDVTISVVFTSPTGKTYTVGGFGYDFDATNKVYTYKARFAPREVGNYTWSLTFTNSGGQYTNSGSFASTASASNGFLRQSPIYPGRFVTEADNKPFYIFGYNLGYTNPGNASPMHGQIEAPFPRTSLLLVDTFKTYRRAGMSIYRSNLQAMLYMTGYNAAGSYNTYNTTLLLKQDELVQAAHDAGLKILSCFTPSVAGTYNFSNPGELQATLRFHQYMIDRFGAYVDMWELGNELGGVTQTYVDTITSYCDAHDPYQHPITVSFQQWRPNALTWIDETPLDAANLHVYSGSSNLNLDNDIAQTTYNSNSGVGLRAMRNHYPNRPLFSGEQGNASPFSSYDPERFRIHLWTDTANEGGPIFWQQMSKTYVGSPLSNLYIGVEERSMARVWANLLGGLDAAVKTIPNTVTTNLRGYTMGSDQNVMGYFLHTNSHTSYLSGAKVTLAVPGDAMLGQWIDPRSGNILQNFVVNSGTQTLALPDFLCDVALRIRPAGAAPVLEFTSGSYLAQENQGSVILTVTRSNNTAGAVSVNYSTGDGQAVAGTNYTAASGTLNWADGDMTSKQIVIPLQDNGLSDYTRDFQVLLSSPAGAVLGGNNNALVNVFDVGTAGGGQPAIYVTRAGSNVPYLSKDSVSGAVTGVPNALTYQIANTGSAALNLGTPTLGATVNCTASIATASAATVAAGGSTALVLTVTPTSVGPWACPVSFSTNDPDVVYDEITSSPTHTYYLTATGAASTASGSKITFSRGGNAIANGGTDTVTGTAASTSTVLSYPLLNLGASVLTVGTPAISNLVNCTAVISTSPASSVAAGGSTTLGLTITPAASGAWSCKVSFATNDSSANPVNWTVAGTSATASSPEIAVFRGFEILKGVTEVPVSSRPGVPVVLNYEVRNTGAGTLTLGAPSFGTQTNCSAAISAAPASSVAPDGSTTLGLTITPTAAGAWSVPISFATNDSDENPTNWTVSGSAAAAPTFSLTRSGVPIANFGTDPVPNTRAGSSFVLNYVIANQGNANLTLTAPTFGFLNNCTASFTATPATTVPPGGSTTLDVTITPSGTGIWTAALSLTCNDNNAANTAERWTVRGSVDAASGAEVDVIRAGNLVVDGSIDYGNGGVAGTPAAITYQIANSGTAALTVGAPMVSSLVNCTATLSTVPASSVAAGANTNLAVTITPVGTGTWFATVSFATNDSNENPTDWTIGGSAALPPPSLAFSNAVYRQAEGNSGTSTATITVSRTGNSSGAVGVSYATADGTATAGSDYVATSGTLSWADGDMADKSFTVTIDGDTTHESNETVALSLATPTGGATLGTPASAVLTILNDDAAPQLYDAWAASYGLSGANALDSASPAGDGVPNLIKYALGLNPSQSTTAPTDGTVPGLPRVSMEGSNLCLLYQKNSGKTDLTYTVQASGELQLWATGGITESVQSTSGTIQTIKASVFQGSDPRKFLRLQVTRQP